MELARIVIMNTKASFWIIFQSFKNFWKEVLQYA